MASDPFLDAKVLTEKGSLTHAVGRIEGILEGIREDMKNAADAQRAMVCRLENNETRLDSLETWRLLLGQYEKDRRNRHRLVRAVGMVLLVPGISWAAELTRWLHDIVQRVQPADSRPGPPPRRQP